MGDRGFAKFQATTLLHQILVVDGFGLPESLSPEINQNVQALKDLYPEAEYRLWDGHALRKLMADHFEPKVRQAFDRLEPFAYKADLARYCVLYLYGGLYVDLGTYCVNPVRPPQGIGLAGFRDYDLITTSWVTASTSVIWALPRREEFLIAIDYIVENCRDRFYGQGALYPTGPVVFGRALVAAMAQRRQSPAADDQWMGLTRPITPGKPHENISLVAPDHSLIALRRKRVAGDIAHLGVVGGNNYNDMWRDKNVYGEKNLREKEWAFDDPRILISERGARTDAGIVAVGEDEGNLTFGPYMELTPGQYRLSVHMDGEIVLPRMQIDVAHSSGEQIAYMDLEPGPRSSPAELELIFVAKRKMTEFEFRTHVFGAMKGRISKFRLERWDE